MAKKKVKDSSNILPIGLTVFVGHQGRCIECVVDRDVGNDVGTFYRLVAKEDNNWSLIANVRYIHKSKDSWYKMVKTNF